VGKRGIVATLAREEVKCKEWLHGHIIVVYWLAVPIAVGLLLQKNDIVAMGFLEGVGLIGSMFSLYSYEFVLLKLLQGSLDGLI
jgi:hypothetical protein